MKLLVLNYEYPPIGGGGGIVTQRLVEGLAKQGDEIVVLTSKFSRQKFIEKEKKITIYRLPVLRQRKDIARMHEMFLYTFFSFFFLLYLRLKYSFDAINIHFAIPTGILSWWTKVLFWKPITLVMHGGDLPNKERPKFSFYYKNLGWLIRQVVNFSDHAIVVNPEVKRQLRQLSNRKVHMIPNGVDVEKFSPKKIKKKYDVLFMGRFIPMKNPLLAVEAFKSLKEIRKNAKMLMIGDGYLLSKVEVASKELDITLKKWVPHEKLPAHINKCKVYWSLQHGTNYGSLTLLESMACGLPSVITNVGESTEIGWEKEFLVKHDPKIIAEKTQKLLKNFEKYSKKSRQLAEKYSTENMVQRYRKIIFTS